MDSVKNWFRDNVDQKQMVTLLVTGVVIGTAAYGLRKAGYAKVANVVKGA
jgi:uncharacterized membrane-anchored protein